MIKRDLLYYTTREQVDSMKFSAGANNDKYTIGPAGKTVESGAPLIAWQTAVFIGDTHEIWLRGQIWVCGSVSAWTILTQSGETIQEKLDILSQHVTESEETLSKAASDTEEAKDAAKRSAASAAAVQKSLEDFLSEGGVTEEAIAQIAELQGRVSALEENEGTGNTFGNGSVSGITLGGLVSGTNISGKTAVEVLDTILSPEYAPKWTSPTVTWTKESTYSNVVYEVGLATPSETEVTGFLTMTVASAIGNTTALGGTGDDVTAIGTIFDVTKFLSAGSYTMGYSVVFSAGTTAVKSSKGTATNKTSSDATTLLVNASANASVDSEDHTIKEITVSNTFTVYAAYPIFATTTSIGTLTKQTLSRNTTITLSMPAETGTEKHKFSLPASYTVTSVKVLNTLSGKYENYGTSKFTVTTSDRTLADGSTLSYKVYTRNDGTNGSTSFQITFTV